MKPKILHVTTAKLSSGGVERYLLALCQGLRKDHKFALLSPADEAFSKEIYDLGCAVFPWTVRRAFDPSAARILSAAVQLYRPDIIHFHDTRAQALSLLGRLGSDVKRVRTYHLSSFYYRWDRLAGLRRFAYASFERLLNFVFSDAVVYPSHRGWEDLLRHRYAPPHKAVCIPNGIDLRPFVAESSVERKNAVPVLCTLSRLSSEKNIGLLLEAAAQLKRRGLAFQFWVIGDGPARSALETKARALNLTDDTRFWGRQEDVARFLLQADVFMLASWYEGGRSLAAMEAQAAGCACVLSDVGDHASMAENGRGLTFPEGDATACADRLAFLLENPEARLRMGREARQFALQSYGLNDMADQYRNLYQKVLNGQAG